MKPFEIDFKPTDIEKMQGYLKAIQQLSDYLQEKAESNADKRFIDSLPLVESIGEAASGISKLLTQAAADLDKQIEIIDDLQGLFTHAKE